MVSRSLLVALAALSLVGCGHAMPAARTPVAGAVGASALTMPSGEIDARVPAVQTLVEAFVCSGDWAGKLPHFTSFRFLKSQIPGYEGVHGQAHGWLSGPDGVRTEEIAVEFVAFEDLRELQLGKCWYYPKGGQAARTALHLARGAAAGPAERLTAPARGINQDPDGPAMQWLIEQFIRQTVKPGATPHFTSFRLLAAPMPGGWEGQHFQANGWLSGEGPTLTDVIAVEGAFDREQQLLRYGQCWRFPKTGAPTLTTVRL